MYEVETTLSCTKCGGPLEGGINRTFPIQRDMISGDPFVMVPMATVQPCPLCETDGEV